VVISYLSNQQSQLQNLVIQVYQTDANGNAVGGGTSWNNTAFGSGIGVQADADYSPVLPTFLLLPSLLHLRAVSIMTCEAN
jgi:hypothetical protein